MKVTQLYCAKDRLLLLWSRESEIFRKGFVGDQKRCERRCGTEGRATQTESQRRRHTACRQHRALGQSTQRYCCDALSNAATSPGIFKYPKKYPFALRLGRVGGSFVYFTCKSWIKTRFGFRVP